MFLRFTNPLEFLLRYTVITGVVVAIIGLTLCFIAKQLTMKKRKTTEINKNDKFYVGVMLTGCALVLIGMILIALPIEATFYVG